jgi:choline kinase
MTTVSEAVILMAGQGSRLRGADKTFLKPLVPVLGRPLIAYTLDALTSRGINVIHFVVGYESERIIAETESLVAPGTTASFIKNHEWHKQNGISLLAAAGRVRAPFLLAMADHLFDDTVIDFVLQKFDPALLNIAIDRKLDLIFDLYDAMKVHTRDHRLIDIGKQLRDYDGIDIGLFVCPLDIFTYLEKAKSADAQNDCSLADAVRLIAADKRTKVIDIEDAWWQDVDTPGALQHAEKNLSVLIRS